MHTNYYFLRQLAPALTERLRGYRVASCFSQEKDELVVGLLSDAGAEFWLKAQLGARFSGAGATRNFPPRPPELGGLATRTAGPHGG
ncbi:MAG: hypothetical protein WKG07_42185 [Hymenobacter sp.]